jgi:hypothetical protein
MARLVFLHNERPGQPGRSAFFSFILHLRALLLSNFD